MSYRNKLLFVLIIAVSIIVSVMIVISWMSSNEDIEMLREAYGQVSDTYYNLYLEAKVNPYDSKLNITKFEFNHTQICPSGQCKILYDKNSSGYFSGPDIPESNLITSHFEFTVQDDIGHADLGPKKKAFIERYNMYLYCAVKDIVEDNAQENYYCENANFFGTKISSKYTPTYWTLDIVGVFAAKNNTLGIYGIFTDEKYDLYK